MKLLSILLLFYLTACVTMSGSYKLEAYDNDGNILSKNMSLTAEGSRIYAVRNALCSRYSKSVIKIIDVKTGEELKGESPYQCR